MSKYTKKLVVIKKILRGLDIDMEDLMTTMLAEVGNDTTLIIKVYEALAAAHSSLVLSADFLQAELWEQEGFEIDDDEDEEETGEE
tara:strand:- start:589 stop:846 length:258 start_codon:yes stop_codon:yes gene_type:complete